MVMLWVLHLMLLVPMGRGLIDDWICTFLPALGCLIWAPVLPWMPEWMPV